MGSYVQDGEGHVCSQTSEKLRVGKEAKMGPSVFPYDVWAPGFETISSPFFVVCPPCSCH